MNYTQQTTFTRSKQYILDQWSQSVAMDRQHQHLLRACYKDQGGQGIHTGGKRASSYLTNVDSAQKHTSLSHRRTWKHFLPTKLTAVILAEKALSKVNRAKRSKDRM